MNLYLVKSYRPIEYDTYLECIVSAESEDDARTIHPCPLINDERYSEWINNVRCCYIDTWIPFKKRRKLSVKLIGASCLPRGLVLSSFNAG